MWKRNGFTIIEIVVVLVIIGVLAALALPNYKNIQEKALNREAKASLALVRAAEKIYRMEQGSYYPSPAGTTSNIPLINSTLKLSLPSNASVRWSITLNTLGAGSEFVTATRIGAGADGRIWTLSLPGDADPTCAGGYCF